MFQLTQKLTNSRNYQTEKLVRIVFMDDGLGYQMVDICDIIPNDMGSQDIQLKYFPRLNQEQNQ